MKDKMSLKEEIKRLTADLANDAIVGKPIAHYDNKILKLIEKRIDKRFREFDKNSDIDISQGMLSKEYKWAFLAGLDEVKRMLKA